MPKFIKFIHIEGLTLINSDDIISIDFNRDKLLIHVDGQEGRKADYKYHSEEEFKTMSDAIMEQLEI